MIRSTRWLTASALALLLANGLCLASGQDESNGAQYKPFAFNDPLWQETWYLQPDLSPSMKIQEAWADGYTGEGVVVTVLDDGLEHDHPDLKTNYDPLASFDLNSYDSDPAPRPTANNKNRAGTRLAGLISSAANNSVCSVGVAYNSKIGGIRMLDGDATDFVEAQAFGLANDHIDIYAGAFGPDDNGRTVDGPGPLAKEAIQKAIERGRGGKGSIFVWSSGNGGRSQDDCNCDGYANSIYTIAIGSVAEDGSKPRYSEQCTAILAATYSSGSTGQRDTVTTDLGDKCTTRHPGNGASVGIAAGIIALTLQANPNLTWRDVQHLIVETANHEGLVGDDIYFNGVGRRVSRTFGYGLMDAHAMVTRAKEWRSAPQQRSCSITVKPEDGQDRWYLSRTRLKVVEIPVNSSSCDGGGILPDRLEHVQVTLDTIRMLRFTLLSVRLISPTGTNSTILGYRERDNGYLGLKKWNFTSVTFWDENPSGDWTLVFERKEWGGFIKRPIVITFYGTLREDWKEPDPTTIPEEVSTSSTIAAIESDKSEGAEDVINESQKPEQTYDRPEALNFDDPLWSKSWYLQPDQYPSMKIQKAWAEGYTGKGVVVAVPDDGLEHGHPDLKANYDPLASFDFNGNDSDPSPRYTITDLNRHGTRFAGLISAAANNSACSVGVAYESSIGGIRLLDGNVDDDLEAQALSHANDHVDIYVVGFGPDDDGKTIEGPGPLTKKAIETAIKTGRDGKGNIFVWASGNGGGRKDECNCDGYTNSIYTITIGSVTNDGTKPWYGEQCTAILAAAYSSGGARQKEMVTTSIRSSCTTQHTGSSASAAIAAGIIALSLQANPNLTWRDVQHLVVETSSPDGLAGDDFVSNGVGKRVSRTFGYGLMDAHAMVMQAKDWLNVPQQRSCKVTIKPEEGQVDWPLSPRQMTVINVTVNASSCDDGGILPNRLEHVQLTLNTIRMLRSTLFSVHLVSPSNTNSTMLGFRDRDNQYTGFKNWNLTSVTFWNENPAGKWTLAFERRDWGGYVFQPLIITFFGTLQKDWPVEEQSTPTPTEETTTASTSEQTTAATVTTTFSTFNVTDAGEETIQTSTEIDQTTAEPEQPYEPPDPKDFDDPFLNNSWYLLPGQQPGMNIWEAWTAGYTGKDVVVAILNGWIDRTHPDLRKTYVSLGFVDDSDVLAANGKKSDTRLAGVISAQAGNDVCSVGVAYESRIGGIVMADDTLNDRSESQAFGYKNDYIDIYVGTYGDDDKARTTNGPGPLTRKAIKDAAEMGRDGKGSIIVWSSGNGATYQDDCNLDGYANSIYTIAVGSVAENGEKPYYSERCSAILASTYSGKYHENNSTTVVTTDPNGQCATNYSGNEASVGLAAGIIALALQANPELSWRDLQHLIVQTANPQALNGRDFILNGAGRQVSQTFGYGLMDAHAMVTKGVNWTNTPTQRVCKIYLTPDGGGRWIISPQSVRTIKIPVNAASCDYGGTLPDKLEHVQLTLNTDKMLRNTLFSVHLTSPSQTNSTLLGFRERDDFYHEIENWNLTSVAFWDEDPLGDWTLVFERKERMARVFTPLILTLYGTLEKDWPKEKEPTSPEPEGTRQMSTTSEVATSSTLGAEAIAELIRQAKYLACKIECNFQVVLGSLEPCSCIY